MAVQVQGWLWRVREDDRGRVLETAVGKWQGTPRQPEMFSLKITSFEKEY